MTTNRSHSRATTAAFVGHWATQRPTHVALRWEGGTRTYKELDSRSNRVAHALRAAGVGHGDRVAFLDKNSPELVELFFGVTKLNAVATPINFRLTPSEVADIVEHSGAKIFVAGAEFATNLASVRGSLESARLVAIGPVPGWDDFEDWIAEYPDTGTAEPQELDDVACLLYSSGTTGRPKGVQLTQANVSAGLSQFPSLLGMSADSISMVAMPLYHIGGAIWALAGLREGATNVLVRDIDPSALAETLERERVTHAFLVPAVLQFMLATHGVDRRDFSALDYVIYSGSPISETVLTSSIRTFACRFVQGYGLTETAGMVAQLPATDHVPGGSNAHRLRAIGLPVPGVEIRVVDPDSGSSVPDGELGEIWIRGPMVMKGYWQAPDATKDAIRTGGWLRSGDAGYRDIDGYLYLQDRIKDMIVSGAENIYPAEVENVLMAHPLVMDAAVIGVPDATWGERPLAIVVRAADATVSSDELIAHCRRYLAGFKCPARVEWTDVLPRNPSGKVLKNELRAPYWVGRDRRVH